MNLFDCAERARARTTDPDTSHAAAAAFEASGKGDTHRALVLRAVRRWPCRTAAELAQRIGNLDRYQVSRRLKELENEGEIAKGKRRACMVLGSDCYEYGI